MDDYFQIAANVEVRRENFGCICFDTDTGRLYQYNNDAFAVIEKFSKPITIDQLANSLLKDGFRFNSTEISKFLVSILETGLVDCALPSSKKKDIFFCGIALHDSLHLQSPFSCSLYVTSLCSKRCLHCISNAGPRADSDELSIPEWIRILRKLRAGGVLKINVSGGEPLMKDGILELLKYASELGFTQK